MKISFKQFGSPNHSWGNVGNSISRSLLKLNHEIDWCSTNGYDNFPIDLQSHIKCKNCIGQDHSKCLLEFDYDLSLSYTMMEHFGEYLRYSKKNRFGIWNIDSTAVPIGMPKYYKFCTKVLPSSQFSYDTFKRAGVPENIMVVVPHGYNEEFNNRKEIFELNTNRKRKIFVNFQQNHGRKNLSGVLEAVGRAFTDKDDVVIVFKANTKKKEKQWEVSFLDELAKVKTRYKSYPKTIILNKFITFISDLYRTCDIVFSASNIECFHLPSLEGLAAKKIVIGSSVGGNVDFMNSNNSLLIDGKMVRMPKEYQYWQSDVRAEMFEPNIDHAAELLQLSVNKYDELINKFDLGIEKVREEYTWDRVATQIVALT